MNKKPREGYLSYLNSVISKEKLKDYLEAISSFASLNISGKRHLLTKKLFHARLIPFRSDIMPSNNYFSTLVANRRSVGQYRKIIVPCAALARLFKLSFSLSDIAKGFASTPTIGGLYSTKVYFLSMNVEGLPRGVYHYNIEEFGLELVAHKEAFNMNLYFADTNIDFEDATGLVVFTVTPELAELKYTFRAWRLLYLEVGHFLMNFWIGALNEGLVGTSLGGGFDFEINTLLDIDGLNECYVAAFIFGNAE